MEKFNTYLGSKDNVRKIHTAGLNSNFRNPRRNIDAYKTMNIQRNFSFKDTQETSLMENAYQTPETFETLQPQEKLFPRSI